MPLSQQVTDYLKTLLPTFDTTSSDLEAQNQADALEEIANSDIQMCFHNLQLDNLDRDHLRNFIATRTANVLQQAEMIESYPNAQTVFGAARLARFKKLRSFAMLLNSDLSNLNLLDEAFNLTPEIDKLQRADILNAKGNTALWLAVICLDSISSQHLETIQTHPFVRMALKHNENVSLYKTRYDNDSSVLIAMALEAYKQVFWSDIQSSVSKDAQKNLQYILGHPACADDPGAHTINELAPSPILLSRTMPRHPSLSSLAEGSEEEEKEKEDVERPHNKKKNTV